MNLTSFAGILSLLESHGYFVMFVVMFFEGPLVTYIAAFAASLHLFNVYWVFVLAVLGSTLGDIPYYFIGRWTKKGEVVLQWFGVTESTTRGIMRGFRTHTGKTIAVIKLTPGLPAPGLILAGESGVSLRKFVTYSFLISIPYALFFVLLGYYSGITYTSLSKYFKLGELLIPLIIVLALLALLFFKLLSGALGKRIEKAK